MTDEQVMQMFLNTHPCACGQTARLNGIVLYSDPLKFGWECSCGRAGDVSYTTLQKTAIESRITSEPV